MWIDNYRKRRYMEHLCLDELRNRITDIARNIYTLSDDGKISTPPVTDPEAQLMMERFTHTSEECRTREISFQDILHDFISNFKKDILTNIRIKSIVPQIKNLCKMNDQYIYKFGKMEHLQNSLNRGIFRIAPASSYSDPSLNSAIRDEELKFKMTPPPREFSVSFVDQKTWKTKKTIHPSELNVTCESKVDYYVLCLSHSFNIRNFIEFDYDACFIIKNKDRFIKNVIEIFRMNHPKYYGFYKRVDYIDPLNCNLNDVKIFADKHFRYAYQKEERFVWIPEEPADPLQPVFIELGPLAEYCELISL